MPVVSSLITTAVVWAIGQGSVIMGAAMLGSFGVAAITFGARLLVAYAVSRIFMPKNKGNGGNSGSRVQLPPATNNKLPIVYGTSWLKPIITDVKISEDQKTMWYVCAFSEVSDQFNGLINTPVFGIIKWGDKTLNFSGNKVASWTNDAGETETNVDGKIYVYRYQDGSNNPQTGTPSSAITILQDAQIAASERWTANDLMTKTAFLIIKVTYDQEIGLTGLPVITAEVSNDYFNEPGLAIYDYLINTRYGCAVPLSQINVTALNNLNSYSNVQIPYTDNNGNPQTQRRYQINGPVDTANNCFDNLQLLAEACDSWIQWDEATAQWGVIINRAYDQAAGTYPAQTINDLFDLNDNNIIGSIDFNPIDLNSTYNGVEVTYPDQNIYDQTNSAFIDLQSIDKNPNEPENILQMQLPFTTSNVTAKYLATRKLIQSREDLVVTLNTDFSGIQIDAGDVVRINNEKYKWVDKLFRVMQVSEGKSEDGMLFTQVQLSEYNNQVYTNIDITEFVPSPNTGITDPNIPRTPDAPFVTAIVDGLNPSLTLNITIPAVGVYGAIEIYYSSTTDTIGEYKLLKTLLPTNSNTYVNGTTVQWVVTGLPPGTYYFRTRVVTMTGIKSNYSPSPVATPVSGASLITGEISERFGARDSGSYGTFTNQTLWLSATANLLTFLNRGNATKLIGYWNAKIAVTSPATISKMKISYQVLIDGVLPTGFVTEVLYAPVMDMTTGSGGYLFNQVMPLSLVTVPTAGLHTYSMRIYCEPMNATGTVVAASGVIDADYYMIAEEIFY